MGGTGAEQLRNILRQHISSFATELWACAVLVDMDALRDQDRAETAKQRDVFHKMFVKIIEKGIRDESNRPELGSLHVHESYFLAAKWYSPAGRLRRDESADAMVDLMMSDPLQTRPSKSVTRKSPAAT
ncbi:hypothetical protein [Bradyrhizobium sp. AUGA SZCCT0431]|uniref:hypothetical protein n=1 Tax=Bradyrhizobium sp. AUGA SZCCT0431 TaxID=2807674 RepID=UPI001BADA30E|nr:hypothetical protein [Bradyrhizobium sp. AUGA SZCCT0431]MBR1146189.1 hypothetical protein [Bradyrhizobium sp. AUGA SZCCT0431]